MTRRKLWSLAVLALAGAVVVCRIGHELLRTHDPLRHQSLSTLSDFESAFDRRIYPNSEVVPIPGENLPLHAATPPYGLVLALPWLPPGLSWPAEKIWFAGCQLAAFAAILAFAWSVGRRDAPLPGLILMAAAAGIAGIWSDLRLGNLSTIASGLLVLEFAALAAARPGAGAAFWVLAMVRTQMGWTFATPLLGRDVKAVIPLALGAIAAAALGACLWTGVNPLRAAEAIYSGEWTRLSSEGHTLANLAQRAGLGRGVTLPLVPLAGLGALLALCPPWRPARGLLTRFAIAAMVGRLFAFHSPGDDSMLVFPLAHLGRQAWVRNRHRDWIALLLMATTLWFSPDTPPISRAPYLPIVLWVVLLAWIGITERGEPARSVRAP